MKSGILALLITSFAVLPTLPVQAGATTTCQARVYKVRTCEIDRSSYKKWAYDRCGNRYSYWVTVITYKDVYSNGSYRIRKETVS